MKFENKKRILAKKTAIIAGIVLFGLILPNITVAGIEDLVPAYQLGKQAIQLFKGGIEMTASAIGNAIIVSITQFVFNLLNWLVRAGAAFFNGMLNIGFQSHIDIVKAGWKVTRDLANMFFILFMIVIAFTTILRLNEQYGVKQLLPKIILIALLINFSLVICGAIIDFSNITANFFIKDIKQYVGKGGISGTFVDSLNLLKTNITITDCEELSDKKPEGEEKSEREKCEEYTTSGISQGASNLMTFIVQITVGSVVLLVAAFTLFAGGILLLIRIVVVWFLVMLVPFVFICYIMPALRSNWQKWWKTFLQWCFFAPAYAFFIWLAIKVSLEAKTRDIASMSYPDFDPATGPLSTIWTATPGSALIHYFFIIALLLGGLIAATKMGIYGADTAMKVGKGMYKGAARWTGARIRERAARPMEKVAGGMAKVFGRVPGLRKLAQAPAQVMRAQRADIEKEKKKWAGSSMDTLKSLYPTVNRTQQIAFAQLMAEKGKLSKGGNFKEKDVEKIIKVANIYETAGPMLENRPDLAPLVKKPEETNEQAIEKTLRKIPPEKAGNIQIEALRNKEFGNAVINKMIDVFRPTHYNKIANINIDVMNEITEKKFTNPEHGATPEERYAYFEKINKPLADYVQGVIGQSVGWTFGGGVEKPEPTLIVPGTEKEFREAREKRSGPKEKPFG